MLNCEFKGKRKTELEENDGQCKHHLLQTPIHKISYHSVILWMNKICNQSMRWFHIYKITSPFFISSNGSFKSMIPVIAFPSISMRVSVKTFGISSAKTADGERPSYVLCQGNCKFRWGFNRHQGFSDMPKIASLHCAYYLCLSLLIEMKTITVQKTFSFSLRVSYHMVWGMYRWQNECKNEAHTLQMMLVELNLCLQF